MPIKLNVVGKEAIKIIYVSGFRDKKIYALKTHLISSVNDENLSFSYQNEYFIIWISKTANLSSSKSYDILKDNRIFILSARYRKILFLTEFDSFSIKFKIKMFSLT